MVKASRAPALAVVRAAAAAPAPTMMALLMESLHRHTALLTSSTKGVNLAVFVSDRQWMVLTPRQ